MCVWTWWACWFVPWCRVHTATWQYARCIPSCFSQSLRCFSLQASTQPSPSVEMNYTLIWKDSLLINASHLLYFIFKLMPHRYACFAPTTGSSVWLIKRFRLFDGIEPTIIRTVGRYLNHNFLIIYILNSLRVFSFNLIENIFQLTPKYVYRLVHLNINCAPEMASRQLAYKCFTANCRHESFCNDI